MRFLIFFCIAALAVAQSPPAWFSHIKDYINGIDDTIDILHGFRVEYHHDGRQHLLIFIKDYGGQNSANHPNGGKVCGFVEISPVWEHLLHDQAKVAQISEEVLHQVHSGAAQTNTLTLDQIKAAYGDSEATQECAGHEIREVSYTPSAAILSA